MSKFPKNHGRPWSKSDDRRLIHGWNYGMAISVLAAMLLRTEFAIKCRLELLEKAGRVQRTKVNKPELAGVGVINGRNYDTIFNIARSMIHAKIDLMASLPYVRS